MNPYLAMPLLAVGAVGHVVLWVGIVNRTHGVAMHRVLLDFLTALCGVALVAIPLAVAAVFWSHGAIVPAGPWDAALGTCWAWIGISALVALWATLVKLFHVWHPASHQQQGRTNLAANHTKELDVQRLVDEPLAAPGLPRLLGRLPYNQAVRPWFHEKRIELPRLVATDAELRIVHITDLHMSGRIARRYFEEVFERVNDWQPDVIAITGDLVERPMCLDWVPTTLGRLRAAHGVYFVLGNHDLRVDCRQLRAALTGDGLTDVGGRWCELSVGETRLVVAGNELPWFPPAADLADCPPHDEHGLPVRLLLSHSPDQFGWAEAHGVDLMLAGHCHGGQVRFPLVGAVLAPSVHGTRYTAGVFRRGETVMHVSRGVSGMAPFRFNCPPEVTLLTLRGALG